MNFSSYDIALLTWFNDHAAPWSIPVFQFISNSTTYVSILLVLFILVISIVRKSKSLRTKFIILVVTLIIVPVFSQGLKHLVNRERPFYTYPHIEKRSTGGDSSFPSGHTTEAFALATALSLLFSGKRIVIPVFIWAVLIAYSRMALGVHYPSDVLGGMVIGSFIGWVVPWMFRRTGFI